MATMRVLGVRRGVGLVVLWAVALCAKAGEAAAPEAPAVTVQTSPSANGTLRFQTTLDKKFIAKTYLLKEAKAGEIQPVVAKLLSTESGLTQVVDLGATQLLIVSAPSYMIPELDVTVAALDKKGASFELFGQDSVYYRPKHRLPSELLALANASNGSNLSLTVADDAQNLIYFQDTPETLKAVKASFEEFDKPQSQAAIEVKIVEIGQANDHRIGFLWDAWKRALPDRADATGSSGDSGTVTLSNMSPQALAEFVNYMVQVHAADSKTSTQLNCVQGVAATLTAGDVHRFLSTAQPTTGLVARGTVESSIAGLTITLTPFIGTESIKLQINAQVSTLSGFDPNGLPVINSRSVAASAVLKDGQVFAITGLEREQEMTHEDRVWLLGQIPFLGRALFTTHTRLKERTQLVVLLTPHLGAAGQSAVRPAAVLLPSCAPPVAQAPAPAPPGQVATAPGK